MTKDDEIDAAWKAHEAATLAMEKTPLTKFFSAIYDKVVENALSQKVEIVSNLHPNFLKTLLEEFKDHSDYTANRFNCACDVGVREANRIRKARIEAIKKAARQAKKTASKA